MSTDTKTENRCMRFAHGLAWIQGLYFTVFGLWPLVSIRTFQAVTGEKTDHLVTGREGDHWLVNTVGLLLVVVGVVLLVATWRKRVTSEIILLAVMSALALAAIDIVYVLRGVISPIYLADFVVEVILVACWLVAAYCSAETRSSQ